MENTTPFTTKVAFMLATDVNPTPLIIDMMDVDVAWYVDMDAYASRYASDNGYVMQNWSEKNYGRTVELQVKHIDSGIIEKWTILRSQPVNLTADANVTESSRKCMQPMQI